MSMEKFLRTLFEQQAGPEGIDLNLEREFYHSILENIPTDIVIFDTDHRYLYVNPYAIQNSDLRKYIIGKDDFEYIRYRNGDISIAVQRREKFNKMMQTGEVVIWEDTTVAQNGESHTSLRKLYPIRDHNKNIVLVIGFGIDISERKRNEDYIKNINLELEKKVEERTNDLKLINEEQQAFNAIVAHDLQSPLRSLSGFSSILVREYKGQIDQRGLEMLEILNKNTKHMSALITGLLRFAQLGTASLVIIDADMNAMVKTILEEINLDAYKNNIRFQIQDLPRAACDKTMVGQVWQNLIHNAIKYSSKKDGPIIEIGSLTKNKKTVYFIRDNGVGFDTKYMDRIFKIFQRLHNIGEYEGTGVGLSLVRKIILKHGGDIWAESSPGIGATFFFTLS